MEAAIHSDSTTPIPRTSCEATVVGWGKNKFRWCQIITLDFVVVKKQKKMISPMEAS